MARDLSQAPSQGHLAVLFSVSAAMLALEVLLVRLFELSHWHHFAGLAVSLALIGLGAAGSLLTLAGERGRRWGDTFLVAGVTIQVVGVIAVLQLHAHVAIQPLFAAWDGSALVQLLLVDFAAFVPFLGAGLVIGSIFARWPSASRSIYAANLLGSGAGSLAATVLLQTLSIETAIAMVAFVPAVTLLVWTITEAPPSARVIGLVLTAVGLGVVASPPSPMISDFKALSRALDLPDARVLSSRPGLHGQLHLVRSDSLRVAPGLSLQWTGAVPASDAAIIGSDRSVALPRDYGDRPDHIHASLSGLPFLLRPAGPVLVLGSSDWQSPLAAADRQLVWVEPDRRLLDLAAGRGLSRAERIAGGAYRFLKAKEHEFTVITLDSAFAGGNAATEDYLMTVDGLAAALDDLQSNGILAIPLGISVPPRHATRALTTLDRALTQRGIDQPGRHIAALRGLQDMLLLASPGPLDGVDTRQLRDFAEKWRFDLVWLPGMPAEQANRYHRLDGAVFHETARAILEDGRLPEATTWFTSHAAEAHQPYFWRTLNWARITDFVQAMGRQRAMSYLDWTLILTVFSALCAAVLAFLLIIAPLGRLPSAAAAHSRGSVATFFTAVGLGYMLLELALLQRGILFLGDPVTTAALVFAAFLIGSGLGSLCAPQESQPRDVASIFGAIAGTLVLSIAVMWPLASAFIGLPMVARSTVLAGALLPLAWSLGRAFPWALGRLSADPAQVPWAWGINAFASVVAASLATLVSVQWGQPATIGIAVVCYAAAAWVAGHWVRSAAR